MLGIIGVRLNIVIPPLIIPEFSTLPEAYHHMRNTVGYFPSANEWLVGFGILSFGMCLFFGVLKYVNINVTSNETISEGDL